MVVVTISVMGWSMILRGMFWQMILIAWASFNDRDRQYLIAISPYPIQNPIWKSGATPEALTVSKLATEKDLEDMITARPEMISSGWMLIGRQVRTSFGGIIDLLAIAPESRWIRNA